MDFNRLIKTVTNLNEYITLTRDLQNDSVYLNLKIPFNISTILTLKNIQSIEIEYFNKYEENGAAMKIFELLLHSPPSKTWSLIGKELVCLLHYWLDAIRKHLITHNTQWWLFLKLLLDYIKDIQTKDTSIVNFLIEETAECLLDLATHSIPDVMQKYEIIQTFNSISAASSREIRLAYRDTFQNYFVKLSAVLARAGDARAQEATLAALLRWLLPRQDGAVRRAAADGWLRPAGFREDAVRVFLERPWNNFVKDARDFLNAHNACGDRVTSVICKKLTIGKRVCIMAGNERSQRWLDVNAETGCVSVSLEPPPSRRAVRIAEDNVSAVLFSRESGQTLITLVVLDYCRMYEGEEEGGSGGSVHVVVGTGRDAARLDRALRAVFKDKYQCLFDVDHCISVYETSQSMDVIYGTEEDSRFSVSSQVRQKRGKRGFIVRSKNAGSSKCTSAATTSFAQHNQDLATLIPVTYCDLSQTSGISEVSDTQQIQTRSIVELGKRGHCNVKIKKPNNKDSEGISSRQNKPIEIIQKSINVTVDSSHTNLRTSSKSQFENNINVLESVVVDNNETDEFYPREKVRFIHDVQAIEDFFSQHCKDNRNGDLVISPSLARKINETSSESGDELRILSPDYIVQDFNIDGIPDGKVCQETLESDIVGGFEKNIDNVPIELNTQTKEKTSIMNEASAASNKDTDLKKMNENSTSQNNAKTINDVKLKFTRRKSLCQKPPKTLRSNKEKTLSPITERESVVEKLIVTKNVENVQINPVNTDPKPTLRRKRKLYSPNNMPNEKSEVRGIETSQKKTTTTPETRAKVSNSSTCYKELEQERKRTRSLSRKKNFQNIMSPKTLKQNQIFDSLKDASNGEPTNLVEKRSAVDNTVYNFMSEDEDEYVNKTDLRKTPNKNEKTALKKGPNKSEKKAVLKKGPNKDDKARVTRTRTRKQKKEIDNSANKIPKRRQSAKKNSTNRQKNIAIEVASSERNLIDERIRGEVSDKLNTSLTSPKDLEDISDKDPNPILRRTPQAEYISEDICIPKDDNENIKQRITKTKRILSLKRNKDTPNPNLELRSADNERTISPLPSLVVETVLNPDSDTSTNAVQAWKDIYLGKRVPETEVNTTHNLLSDNNSLCQSPHNIDITERRPTLYLSSDQESNISGKKSPVVLLHRMSPEVIRSLQSNSLRSSDLDDSKMLSNVDLATLNEKLESVITNSRNADNTNKTSEDKRTKTVRKSVVSPILNLRKIVRAREETNNSKMNNTAVNRKIVKNNRRKSVRERLTTESVQRKSETTVEEMEMSKETQTVANSERAEATCGNSHSPEIDHGDSNEEVPFNPISPNEKTPPRDVENEYNMNQSFKYLLTKYTKEFNVSRTLRSSNKNRRTTKDCNEDNDDQSNKNDCSKPPENINTLIPCSLKSTLLKPNSSVDSENILKDNLDKVMANKTNLEGSNVTPKAKSAKAERKSIISPIMPFSKRRLQSKNLPMTGSSKEQTGSVQKRERCMKPLKNTVISSPVASEASEEKVLEGSRSSRASKRKPTVECQPSTSRNAKDSRCDGNNNTGSESSRCPSIKSVNDWFERNEFANEADADADADDGIQNSTNTETPNDVPESSFVEFNNNFIERYMKIIETIQEQRAEREHLLESIVEVRRAWLAVTRGLTDNIHCSDEIIDTLLQLLKDTYICCQRKYEDEPRQRE